MVPRAGCCEVSSATFTLPFGISGNYRVIVKTIEYGSSAQTPWATPLVYPQTLWYAALVIFAVYAAIYGVRASRLFFSGQRAAVLEEFHPKSAKEELKDELDHLAQRSEVAR